MYLPRAFQQTDPLEIVKTMTQSPFATLIVQGTDSSIHQPYIDHLPLLIDKSEDGSMTLRGHLAVHNPLCQYVEERQYLVATVIFHGAHHYISPRWYPSKARGKEAVPTWNYNVVHASGILRLERSPPELVKIVDDLSQHFEQQIASGNPWKLSDASPQFIEAMLKGIVGIVIDVNNVTAKSKSSQNRSAEDRDGVRTGLRSLSINDIDIEQLVINP